MHAPRDSSIRETPDDLASSEDILDALPDPVLLVERSMVVRSNDAARRIFNAGQEIAGKSFESMLAPGDLGRFTALDRQRSLGWPLALSCRLRFVQPDGAVLVSDVRWTRMSAERVLITARDITEVTRAEDLMARLAQLPSSLDGANALLDAAAPIFQALRWTVAFTEIVEGGSVTHRLLADEGDPVGEYGRSILGQFITRERTPVLSEVVRTGSALYLDNIPKAISGPLREAIPLANSMERARVARSAWCPIQAGASGVTHLLAVTGRDITEHDFVAIQLFAAQVGAALRLRALRTEMVQRERLAAVGEMAAVLAHEVRNPLAVMFNALSTLQHIEPQGGDRQALLVILREEADRLRRLVTDLLEFATASAPTLTPTSLAPVLSDALSAARHDESFVLAEPEVELRVAEDLVVRSDARLLRRALLNVILNAFQHVSRNGRVGITAERLANGDLAISVSNDGPPIPAEIAGRIFEPFFTTKPSGTGLGLAIVRRTVEEIGARVRSVPRTTGAEFEIVLPGGDA